MKEIIYFNKAFKPIDKEYFNNYGGDKYSDIYLQYTTNPKIVIKDLLGHGIYFKKLLDVGCASGEVVRDFRRLGIDAYGIENNKTILKRCVVPKYCTFGDMYDLSAIKDNTFDVIYTNSLMYAWPMEILKILQAFHRITTHVVYLCCPFLDTILDLNNDLYRTFIAKESWWDQQFKEAEFKKVSTNIYTK